MGELSCGVLTGPAGTVTVTVFAEVTVTVAGPHSPPAEDRPVGELPEPDPPDSLPDDTGRGTTVTVCWGNDPVPVPVPAGPPIVEFPKPYGADEEPIGLEPLREDPEPPVGTPLGRLGPWDG